MNVIPNTFLSAAVVAAAAANGGTIAPNGGTIAPSGLTSPPAAILLRSPNPSSHTAETVLGALGAAKSISVAPTTASAFACAICAEALNEQSVDTYQFLSVRPSIGSPAGQPFFPVLETTNGPARVAACQPCAAVLLTAWADYERKAISIASRHYDLAAVLRSKALVLGSGSTTPTSSTAAAARPINLTTTNNTNGNMTSNESEYNAKQVAPLDLSCSSKNVTTAASSTTPVGISTPQTSTAFLASSPLNLTAPLALSTSAPRLTAGAGQSFVSSSLAGSTTSAQGSPVRLFATTGPGGKPILLNIAPGTTLRKATDGTNAGTMVATSTTPLFLSTTGNGGVTGNSSMTNLIKVATAMVAEPKRCAVCEEHITQLMQVALKPLANCPYFPTLPVKPGVMDSMGKIGTCENCHRQLIQQWDAFQKQNIPINERNYIIKVMRQVIIPNNIAVTSPAATSSVAGSVHIPSLTTTATAGAAPVTSSCALPEALTITLCAKNVAALAPYKSVFACGWCAKDLLSMACNLTHNSHLVYAMMTEQHETVANGTAGTMKKLLLQTAVEVNLFPFLTTPITASLLQQLKLMQETGKVFVCFNCFDGMRMVKVAAPAVPTNDTSKVQSSLNGTNSTTTTTTTLLKTSDAAAAGANFDSDLCQACGHNKAGVLIETKETAAAGGKITPFFPFLASVADQFGRARICGACHLMLETQWDAFELDFIPYHLRQYRLTTSVAMLSKRLPINASAGTTNASGTLVMLPNNASGHLYINSALGGGTDQQHLLLTTVNHARNVVEKTMATPSTTQQQSPAIMDDRVYHLADEFLACLGGPQQMLAGQCAVCGEQTPPGSTYSVYSSAQNFLISKELGLYPYFPFLNAKNANGKKNTSKNAEIVHLVCVFCYHSLIVQWAAFNLSSVAEDLDPNHRVYNCNEYYCYVCGVVAYRSLIKTIKTKDFPFLLEHKRPPGALILCKGEKVVACVNCFETLTHQLLENERMKVPLEMRKYNWIAMPQAPPTSEAKTLLPDLSSMKLAPSPAGVAQHNGLPAAGTLYLKPTIVTVSTANNSNNQQIFTHLVPSNISLANQTSCPSSQQQQQQQQSTPSYLAPSYTLEPLVAAAMAAKPVSMASRPASVPGSRTVTVVDTSKTIFADALRDLVKQQKQDALLLQQQQNIPNQMNHQIGVNNNHSFNLSTLADVAVHVDNQRNGHQQQQQKLLLTTIPSSNAGQLLATNRQPIMFDNRRLLLQASNQMEPKDIQQQIAVQQQTALQQQTAVQQQTALQQQTTQPNRVLNGEMKTYSTRQSNRKRNATTAQLTGINANNKRQNAEQSTIPAETVEQAKEQEEEPKKKEEIKPIVPFYERASMSKVELDCKWIKTQKEARFQQLKRMNQVVNRAVGVEQNVGQDQVLQQMVEEEFSDCFSAPPPPERQSLLPFIAEVHFPKPYEEDGEKTRFLSSVGLLCRRVANDVRAQKLALKRRLNKLSPKALELSDPVEDVLLSDFELCDAPRIDPSRVRPDDPRLEQLRSADIELDKHEFLQQLGLTFNGDVRRILKAEMNWLAVLDDRRRRRRRYSPFGSVPKVINNIEENVYRQWLEEMFAKGEKVAPDLVAGYRRYMDNLKAIDAPQPIVIHAETNEEVAQSNSIDIKEEVYSETSQEAQRNEETSLVKDVNETTGRTTTITPNNLANGFKPFSAQDFHNEVFFKTQLAEMSRAYEQANASTTPNPQQTLPQPEIMHSKDKTGLKDEIERLQKRLADNSIEAQRLLEQKAEILIKLQRIENDNVQIQASLDRLVTYTG